MHRVGAEHKEAKEVKEARAVAEILTNRKI
jgi:hypothetical protein